MSKTLRLHLRQFTNAQYVEVVDVNSPLRGKFGHVVRLRRADSAAWVMMDDELPDALRSFPFDDPNGRGNNVLLWPEQCAAALVHPEEPKP